LKAGIIQYAYAMKKPYLSCTKMLVKDATEARQYIDQIASDMVNSECINISPYDFLELLIE